MTFGVRVGGYGAESTGKAYFDDVRLEKVDALPSGVFASVWYDTQSYVSYDTATTQQTGQKSTALFVVLGVLFGFLYLLARPLLSRGGADRRAVYAFACVMAAALAVRIVLAVNVPAIRWISTVSPPGACVWPSVVRRASMRRTISATIPPDICFFCGPSGCCSAPHKGRNFAAGG